MEKVKFNFGFRLLSLFVIGELAWFKKLKLAFETRTHFGYSKTIKIAHLQ
ncbi:MAG: hypothetical protein RHS_3656 [Robinsoniella sp. RHS]|nr:MAG: hypothetical protein RHS_3656 [Robinsoniella sp. RHS]